MSENLFKNPFSTDGQIPMTKEEKLVAFLVKGGLLVAGVIGLYFVLPILISVTTNLIILGAEVAAIWSAIYVVFTKNKIKSLLKRGFNMFINKLTYAIMTFDPISFLDTVIEDAQIILEKATVALANVAASRDAAKTRIKNGEERRVNILKQADVAQTENLDTQFALASNELIRVDNGLKEDRQMHEDLNEVVDLLEENVETARFTVEDMSGEREYLKVRYSVAQNNEKALLAVYGIIGETSDVKKNYKMVSQHVKEYYTQKISLLRTTVNMNAQRFSSQDLQRNVNREDLKIALKEFRAAKGTLMQSSREEIQRNMVPEQVQDESTGVSNSEETPVKDKEKKSTVRKFLNRSQS